MLKRSLAVAVAISALASIVGPGYAAERKEDDPVSLLEKDKKLDREAVDKQYHRAMEQTSAKTGDPAKADPWANMRGTTDVKKSK